MNYFTVLMLVIAADTVHAQDLWDLQRCVEYALSNNISIKQTDIQARMAEVNFKQSQQSRIPTLGLNGNMGYSSGRNQDPTTFDLITQGFWTSGYTLQSSVSLFNWFSLNETIKANRLEAEAAYKNLDRIKNDISLNVAAAYLQALLNKEQVKASQLQIELTKAQLQNTQKLVAAGSVPELNAAELEAQLARDSSTLVSTQMMELQSLLQLKALLNLDAAVPFGIDTPDVKQIPVEPLALLQPEDVYAMARINMPVQQMNILRVEAAQASYKAARANMLPTFSMFGNLGTNTNSQASEIISTTPIFNRIGTVEVGGVTYDVMPLNPMNIPMTRKQPYFDQVNQNFRQSVGIGVNIPILSNGSLRANKARQKLNVENVILQQQLDDLNLKQDIHRAYAEANNALQKFHASQKAVAAAQKVYDYATKRYENGMLQTLELITNQNNLFRATIDLISAEYDYVFKLKVLEFYKGQGIKL